MPTAEALHLPDTHYVPPITAVPQPNGDVVVTVPAVELDTPNRNGDVFSSFRNPSVYVSMLDTPASPPMTMQPLAVSTETDILGRTTMKAEFPISENFIGQPDNERTHAEINGVARGLVGQYITCGDGTGSAYTSRITNITVNGHPAQPIYALGQASTGFAYMPHQYTYTVTAETAGTTGIGAQTAAVTWGAGSTGAWTATNNLQWTMGTAVAGGNNYLYTHGDGFSYAYAGAFDKKTYVRNHIKNLLTASEQKARNAFGVMITPEETRARQTLREMVTESEFRKYLTNGFVMVKGKSGKFYQVFISHNERIRVYEKGKHTHNLCIHTDSKCPPTDHVVNMKTIIECDEDSIYKLSNTHAAYGSAQLSGNNQLVAKPKNVVELWKSIKTA